MRLPVQHGQLGAKAPALAAQQPRRAKAAKLTPMATATVDRPTSTSNGASNGQSAYGNGAHTSSSNGAAKAEGPVILNGQVSQACLDMPGLPQCCRTTS